MVITISKYDDVIDSRDVMARIEALESAQEDSALDDDESAELTSLRALAKEGADYCGDWQYGAQLIRDTYFKNYAMELAADCGMIEDNAKWPHTCIDWDMAARDLKMDYTPIEFEGMTYWIR